jgi:hypothetical protein
MWVTSVAWGFGVARATGECLVGGSAQRSGALAIHISLDRLTWLVPPCLLRWRRGSGKHQVGWRGGVGTLLGPEGTGDRPRQGVGVWLSSGRPGLLRLVGGGGSGCTG